MKKNITSAIQQQYIADYRTFLLMRNYAPSTIKSYVNVAGQFWSYCAEQQQQSPGFDKAQAPFLWFKRITEKFGAGTVYSQNYSALKLFYNHLLKRDWATYGILRPRRVRNLPEVMSQAEVDTLVFNTPFPKHQTAFITLYATGLRIGELVKVKLEDINPQTRILRVRQGKGRKDRFIPLTEPFMAVLDQYIPQYQPVEYLFNGANIGQPISARAIQHAFQMAKQKARLNPKITPHTLRHAFATHHLDQHTHLAAIKSLLGHSSFKSTARYLHMSVQSLHQFHSPADELCKKFIK